eukprot:sb/3466792/
MISSETLRNRPTQVNNQSSNQNCLFRSRDWLSANQGPVVPDSVGPTSSMTGLNRPIQVNNQSELLFPDSVGSCNRVNKVHGSSGVSASSSAWESDLEEYSISMMSSTTSFEFSNCGISTSFSGSASGDAGSNSSSSKCFSSSSSIGSERSSSSKGTITVFNPDIPGTPIYRAKYTVYHPDIPGTPIYRAKPFTPSIPVNRGPTVDVLIGIPDRNLEDISYSSVTLKCSDRTQLDMDYTQHLLLYPGRRGNNGEIWVALILFGSLKHTILGHIHRPILGYYVIWNRPNQKILVPDWLITSHVTKITTSDWLFTCVGRFLISII